jgi:hypothetical protein
MLIGQDSRLLLSIGLLSYLIIDQYRITLLGFTVVIHVEEGVLLEEVSL